MLRLTLVAVAALLAGCASSGSMDMSGMSEAQLKAMVSDKNFTAICSTVTGMGGQGKFVYTNVDRSVVTNGAITVAPDCTVTMSNAPNPPKPTKE
jgi:ABC-type Fe3+-hydroxamate transport system substrate-binding protein